MDEIISLINTKVSSAAEMAKVIKERMADVKLEPDEDYSPTAFLAGVTDIAVFDVGFFLGPRDEPGRYFAGLFNSIPPGELSVGASLSVAWQVIIEPEDKRVKLVEEGKMGPADMLDIRREVAFICAIDRESEVAEHAYVIRESGQPPLLSEWKSAKADLVSGRIPESIIQAVRGEL